MLDATDLDPAQKRIISTNQQLQIIYLPINATCNLSFIESQKGTYYKNKRRENVVFHSFEKRNIS